MSIGHTAAHANRPQLIVREMEASPAPWAVLRHFRGGYRQLATFGTREAALLEFPKALEYFGSMSPVGTDDTE